MLKPERKAMLGVVSTKGAGNMFRDTSLPGGEMEEARILPLDLIDPNPDQARKVFDQGLLEELAESIKEQGVLQPIVVRPLGERFQVVAGERRLRAALLAGLMTIPAIIKTMDDNQATIVMAIENLQRQDLTDIETINSLVAYATQSGESGREIARRLGKSRAWVNRRLAIYRHPDIYARVSRGELTLDGAEKEIARLNNPEPLLPPVESGTTRATFEDFSDRMTPLVGSRDGTEIETPRAQIQGVRDCCFCGDPAVAHDYCLLCDDFIRTDSNIDARALVLIAAKDAGRRGGADVRKFAQKVIADFAAFKKRGFKGEE